MTNSHSNSSLPTRLLFQTNPPLHSQRALKRHCLGTRTPTFKKHFSLAQMKELIMLQIPSPIKTCLKLFSVFGAQSNLQMVKPFVVGFIGLQAYRLVWALIVIKPCDLKLYLQPNRRVFRSGHFSFRNGHLLNFFGISF